MAESEKTRREREQRAVERMEEERKERRKKEEMERVRNSAEYGAYKKRQRQIKALEDALIYGLKKSGQVHILNKTRGKKGNVQPEFEGLVASIGEVLKLDPGWIVNN
mgnify:CR=1 FL=1